MRKYKIASILILMYLSFIVPYFQNNMNLMLIAGLIYKVVRVIGAVGLWKNWDWFYQS